MLHTNKEGTRECWFTAQFCKPPQA